MKLQILKETSIYKKNNSFEKKKKKYKVVHSTCNQKMCKSSPMVLNLFFLARRKHMFVTLSGRKAPCLYDNVKNVQVESSGSQPFSCGPQTYVLRQLGANICLYDNVKNVHLETRGSQPSFLACRKHVCYVSQAATHYVCIIM